MLPMRKTQRFTLESISNRPKEKVSHRIVINGIAGIGKTSLAAQFPSPVFIQSRGESGLQVLESAGICSAPIMPFEHDGKTFYEAQSYEDVADALDWLASNDHPYKTLCIDVLNGVEKLIHESVCNSQFGGDWGDKGFSSFMRGYEVSLPKVKDLCIRLDRLRMNGMTIVLLCHTKVKNFKNPVGPDYDQYVPDMHEKTWNILYGWSDIVLFCNAEVEVKTDKSSDKKGKAISQTRVMYTEGSAAWHAKNRHNLPPEIEMGRSAQECYANLVEAMKQAKTQNQKG
ncbi:ATP-binding protein [bacterium]|nr:ATP-binding protein [bacterium]